MLMKTKSILLGCWIGLHAGVGVVGGWIDGESLQYSRLGTIIATIIIIILSIGFYHMQRKAL